MKVSIEGPPVDGACCVTGRSGPVWKLVAGNGAVQTVGSKSLEGALKLLTSVPYPLGSYSRISEPVAKTIGINTSRGETMCESTGESMTTGTTPSTKKNVG